MPSKKRFNFATVRMTRSGDVESVVRRHTSLHHAMIYCGAKNECAEDTDAEYAVLVRPDNRPARGGELPDLVIDRSDA